MKSAFPRQTAFKSLLCLLLPLGAAQACGPDFSPDVFVRSHRPDLPQRFAEGHLGLLQNTFPRADLLVAYRYLGGGTLDREEQRGGRPSYSPNEPEDRSEQGLRSSELSAGSVDEWLLARGKYLSAPPRVIGQDRNTVQTTPGGGQYYSSIPSCADDAFHTAALTLTDRAVRWGADSPALQDWLRAQDVVFSNCPSGSETPAPAPAGAPALLASDRAYQVAAAHFYSLSYDSATSEFRAISQDRSSPWQPLAGYLAARSLVRHAFFTRRSGADAPSFDPARMQAASNQLQSYLAAAPPPHLRQAAEAALALVRLRLEPEQRARELATLLAGPGHDPNYAQDLKDLLWLLDDDSLHGPRLSFYGPLTYALQGPAIEPRARADKRRAEIRERAAAGSTATTNLAPIIDWNMTFRGLGPAPGEHALEQWRRRHTLPWLIAALSLAADDSAEMLPLMKAAAELPETSPGWETATYDRIRLLIAGGHAEQARTALASALPKVQAAGEPSSINAYRHLSMFAAPDLVSALAFAPRAVLLDVSEETNSIRDCHLAMSNPNRRYNCIASVGSDQFDQDFAGVLNRQAPLLVWLAAAQEPALAPQLRDAIVLAGWTRAVLLNDQSSASAFLPLLPAALKTETGANTRFEQLLVLTRNPGLVPYLNPGSQRSYSYDFVESFRENWCYAPADGASPGTPAFLAAGPRQAGLREAAALAPVRETDLARQLVVYVQAHPEEPRAAESLYLVLRLIRYGCGEAAMVSVPSVSPGGSASVPPTISYDAGAQQLLLLKQEAARLLRRRYAASPWTAKAAPFAG